MLKTPGVRTTFGGSDVEKVHAIVARSTCRSQNVLQSTPASYHFWKLRCRKSARRCGAKHIFKVKMYKAHHVRTTFGSWDVEKVNAVVAPSTYRSQHVQKHQGFGPLLEVEMSKKCTLLWREAHFEVKMLKTPGVRTTFGGSDVEKVHAVAARSAFRSQNVQNTRGSDHFWRFKCRSASLHYITLHYTPLHYITLHSSTLHYTTLHSNTLHYTEWHYTTLHYTTLRSTTLHYITLHYSTLHYTSLHYTTLSSTTLHYLTLHYTTLHYTTTTTTTTQLHSTTLHYTPLHSTTLRYTPLH